MNLKINLVHNSNTPNKEYVVLEATAEAQLAYYAVVDRTFEAGGAMSNEHRHIYFFPARKLAKGSLIVLFSGVGINGDGDGKLEDGTPFYTYYWQSGVCIWNDKGGDTASLIRYTNGNTVKVPPIVK